MFLVRKMRYFANIKPQLIVNMTGALDFVGF